MWSVVTLHSVLPSECNISANVAYWDSVCARRQYLEPHFPQLHPQTPWALPVAASLMHNPKAGGSTLKRILRNLASAHNLTVCGVPAQYHIPVAATELTPAEQQACRISFTTPGSTFEVANLTRRPTILLTTLRPPVDHYVSAYNYVCVCNVERRQAYDGACTESTTFEQAGIRVAWEVIDLLLNGNQSILHECVEIATSLGGTAEQQLEDTVLQMLTDRLSLPCISTIPTYEIDAYLPLLRHRWQPYGLSDVKPIKAANTFTEDRCPASQRHWLQDKKSEVTLQRLSAVANQSLPMRVHDRLWQWFQANGRDLWGNNSAPCMISMAPADHNWHDHSWHDHNQL